MAKAAIILGIVGAFLLGGASGIVFLEQERPSHQLTRVAAQLGQCRADLDQITASVHYDPIVTLGRLAEWEARKARVRQIASAREIGE